MIKKQFEVGWTVRNSPLQTTIIDSQRCNPVPTKCDFVESQQSGLSYFTEIKSKNLRINLKFSL